MSLTVGLTYDLRKEYARQPGEPEDVLAEFDHEETVAAIEEALVHHGYRVVRIGNVRHLMERLHRLRVDIVFNIAEGVHGRNRESQVPILLEMAEVPFVGSDGLTMGLTLDKVMTKKILISEGIPTPAFFEVAQPGQIPEPLPLVFPMIVKPRCEGSSKGVTESSRVTDLGGLERQTALIIEQYHQPALVEAFISGSEFTVPVFGNDPPEALPVVQIEIDGKTALGDLFYAFSRVWDRAESLRYLCPAKAPEALQRRLRELALSTYRAVECRDFGRVDFRVDAQGRPYVLEINPLPSLSLADVLPQVAKHLGIAYDDMIVAIVEYGLKRHGLLEAATVGGLWHTSSR